MDAMCGAADSAPSVWASSGRPPILASSLSVPPIRSEAPAATTIASALPTGTLIEPRLGEDHATGHGLKDTGDRDVEVLVDMTSPAFDDDHRPVVEEADTLPGFFALLDHPDPQLLPGKDGRLHGVGQGVDVHHPHALELGDSIEVEVVREDHPAPRPGEGHELGIHLGLGRHRILDDLDGGPGLLLHAGQDLESATAAVPAERVGGVGDVL